MQTKRGIKSEGNQGVEKRHRRRKKAAIARELGVSREALFNKLEQMGWQETNPYRKKKIDLTLFLKVFNEGKTYQEMAAVFQCCRQTIINKVKELQLSRHKNKKRVPEKQEKRCVLGQAKEECFR